MGYSDSDLVIKKRDSTILSVRVYFKAQRTSTQGGTRYWVEFRDSYQLLPQSLDKLCDTFNIYEKHLVRKTSFDHTMLNSTNYLDGPLYELLKHYLIMDVKSLYYVLFEFENWFLAAYNFNPLKFLTLPQLSLQLFRRVFYEPDALNPSSKITILRGVFHNFISDAYYGGCTVVYKPSVQFGYYYDVNSMFPSAMLNFMPTGHPCKYDITCGLKNLFGFARVSVEAPDIKYPILPIRTEYGLIYGCGSWVGTYFSEELKYAESLGYKITLIEAISFDKSKPFNKFVNHFYNLKSSARDLVQRFLAKLLLNSLYGKMGQKPITRTTKIVSDNDTLVDLVSKYEDVNITCLTDGVYLVSYDLNPNENIPTDSDLFIKL